MKTITSAGGPYVILDHKNFQSWGANVKKSFSRAASPFPDDYEAAGDLTDGVNRAPCHIAKLMGESTEALLISLPFEITIIQADDKHVYLVQVEYAELDWSLSEVHPTQFERDDYEDVIPFISQGGAYTLFDAACLPTEVGEDCLRFSLDQGGYTFSARYDADQTRGIFFYKIDRTVSAR